MTISPLRRMLCAALCRLVSRLAEADIHESEAWETLTIRGWRLEVYASRVPDDTPVESAACDLSEVERAALAAATATPVSRERLAKLAGYSGNSYFSAAVTSLLRKRLLTQGPEGIALA